MNKQDKSLEAFKGLYADYCKDAEWMVDNIEAVAECYNDLTDDELAELGELCGELVDEDHRADMLVIVSGVSHFVAWGR